MNKFSIITPQFNSFSLMDKYFKALEEQTFKDFEVIIVDDCSTDNSWDDLNVYASKSALNIKLIKAEKNAGPGNARNLGIEAAEGEWITFVDNDDWIDVTLLERVNDIIEHEKVNCVIYDYSTWLDGKVGKASSMYINKPGRKTVAECIQSVRNHTFGKFYKREKCKDVRFPNVRRCEDVAYVSQAIAACGDAYYLAEPLYYYRQRPTSLSNNKKMDESDMINAFAILEEKFSLTYPAEIKEKSVTDILYGALLMMCKSGKDNSYISNYIKQYEEKYPEWWKCEIINHIGKAKQAFLTCARWHFVFGLKSIAFAHSLMIKKGS